MDFPEAIYKYRDWNNSFHKRILTDTELYFTSPNAFNDPFDCKITPNYEILKKEEKKIEFINLELNSLIEIGNLKKSEFNNHFKNFENKFRDFYSFIEGLEKQELSFINKHYGVASFSKLWNSILMWSHYGNHHKGFCVGFYEQKFRESKKYLRGGLVFYGKEFPNIEPVDKRSLESLFKVTHYKAEQWNYEEEYRIVKLIQNESDRVDKIPVNYIKEIILGSEIREEDKNEIITFSKNNNIALYQAYKIKRMFELNRTRII